MLTARSSVFEVIKIGVIPVIFLRRGFQPVTPVTTAVFCGFLAS